MQHIKKQYKTPGFSLNIQYQSPMETGKKNPAFGGALNNILIC